MSSTAPLACLSAGASGGGGDPDGYTARITRYRLVTPVYRAGGAQHAARSSQRIAHSAQRVAHSAQRATRSARRAAHNVFSKCPSKDWRNPMLIDLYNKALRTKCRALNGA